MGRLSSPHAIFGKFTRTQMRPMYEKLHRVVYPDRLPPYEKTVLRWRKEAVAELAPAWPFPGLSDHIGLYTDAATRPTMLCALLFHGNRAPPPCTSYSLLCSGPRCLAVYLPHDCADLRDGAVGDGPPFL